MDFEAEDCSSRRSPSSDSDPSTSRRLRRPRNGGAKYWLVAFSLIAAIFSATITLAASYMYDANGRLIVVKDDSGQAAQYIYDNVGNLVRIDRFSTNELAVAGFTPLRGAVGTHVSIQGHGFSTTPAQNSVSFNGAPATIVSATAGEIVASVPLNATTGPISVTVGAVTASSSRAFVVDANARPPLITSVSPLIVQQGATISVLGQHMEPEDGETTVRVGSTVMGSASVEPLTATFAAPARTMAGKISVSTLHGTAYSIDDVLVLPSGLSSSNISQVIRMSPDAPAVSMATTGPGNRVAVLFDASFAHMLSMQFSNISASSLQIDLYRPDGALMVQREVRDLRPTYHLPKLVMAGTYLALVRNDGSAASWQMQIEKDKRFLEDLDTLSVGSVLAGQSKRFVYEADSGTFGVKVTDITGGDIIARLSSNYGEDISQVHCAYSAGCELDAAVPRVATYSLILEPSISSNSIQAQAALLLDHRSEILPNVAYPVALSPAGRNGRFSFQAGAGDTYGILISNQQTVPSGRGVYYSLYAPNGEFQGSTYVNGTGVLSVASLQTTGTYTLLADPDLDVALTATITVVPALIATANVDGDSVNFATEPGQSVRVNFTIAGPIHLGVGIHELVTPGSTGNVEATVLTSSGTKLIGTTCNASRTGCEFDFSNLAPGSYSLEVSPPINGEGTMLFGVTLSTDLVVNINRSVATPIAVSRYGQNVRIRFDATQGEWLGLGFADQVTNPSGESVLYSKVNIDGSVSDSYGEQNSGSFAAVGYKNITETRKHEVFVDPEYGGKLSVVAKVETNYPQSIAIDSLVTFSNPFPAGPVYIHFVAPQGANLGVGITQLNAPGGTQFYGPRFYIRATSGAQYAFGECIRSMSGCDYDLENLPAGTYEIEILSSRDGDRTFSLDLGVYPDVASTLQPNVPAATSVTNRGQNARLSFSATSGKGRVFEIQNMATTPSGKPVSYRIYSPNGWLLTSFTRTGDATINLPTMSSSGTYTVLVDPAEAATFSASFKLYVP
ncbi:IPT/TIG domain-containing protein [Pseudoxanthomonas wuyuanensis]|uniref:YD repeat-containing protein n=1 Tax=Pseudoxanthomonas wuyuanensis TaxID=1073196 RepID=A0A286CWG8_9GAMM|nr:IPT/TIG domain-containing protein [Pseudoxanthomonas wuyuanensis]KAF1720924.1 hypothetical protein CSC75_09565 [Pseudoxanthomonas wuyuanensis]SOD50762.1 YD repeat-containing protein [Pseudoxanthomonas wuyuanensis]